MTIDSTKYAIDLSNDGVELWYRDAGQPWQLLGNITLSADNFSQEIERLKAIHGPDGDKKFIAQVRIPPSEIFVSDIDLNDINAPDITPKVNDFLAQNTPYAAQDLVFDLENQGDTDSAYVAAITKQTMAEAKEFITGCGFEAAFYTSNLDTESFPRPPRFYDGARPETAPEPTPAPPVNAPDILAEKASSTSDFMPPPPVRQAKVKTDAEKETTEKPLTADKGTALNTFETVRSKLADSDSDASNKTGPAIEKSIPVPPPPRISINAPLPKAKPPTASGPVGPIKTRQGDTAKTGLNEFFKLRYIAFIAVVGLLALVYWFYTAMFDGKEEITLLQQIPATEPYVVAELQSLKHLASSDSAPTLAYGAADKAIAAPRVEMPKPLALPAQIASIENIDKTAPVQKIEEPAPEVSAPEPEKPVETPTEVSKAVDTGAGSTPDVPKDTEEAPTKTVDGQNQAADTDVALLEPAPDNVANGAEVITPVAPETTPIEDAPDLLAMADPALKSILPKSRPPSIATIAKEFANSLTASADPALSTLKPKIRPANLRIFAEKVDPLEIEVAIRQAVGETLRPALRPKSLGKTVARTNANAETTALITKLSPDAARGTSKTGSPSPVNIQKEATEKTRFNKKRMSLIGVFGKPSARHALLRMPSGRFVKVVPGQKVSGWKVAAIGESTVRITKGSRNQVLRMPK